MNTNQCDGCRRKLPINHNGIHYDPNKKGHARLYMVCVAKDYVKKTGENNHKENCNV